jgi:hypothetical protein
VKRVVKDVGRCLLGYVALTIQFDLSFVVWPRRSLPVEWKGKNNLESFECECSLDSSFQLSFPTELEKWGGREWAFSVHKLEQIKTCRQHRDILKLDKYFIFPFRGNPLYSWT